MVQWQITFILLPRTHSEIWMGSCSSENCLTRGKLIFILILHWVFLKKQSIIPYYRPQLSHNQWTGWAVTGLYSNCCDKTSFPIPKAAQPDKHSCHRLSRWVTSSCRDTFTLRISATSALNCLPVFSSSIILVSCDSLPKCFSSPISKSKPSDLWFK